jgi:cell wall-associated NlpC family hydrolase
MLEKFVGVPYVPNGRDYGGADCWGILFLYYRDVLGSPIPSYSAEMEAREFRRNAIAPLMAAEREKIWRQVEQPQTGDGILIRAGGHESHVGVYIGNGRMLHSEGPGPSTIERIGDMRWKNRISGFYRLIDADNGETTRGDHRAQ